MVKILFYHHLVNIDHCFLLSMPVILNYFDFTYILLSKILLLNTFILLLLCLFLR